LILFNGGASTTLFSVLDILYIGRTSTTTIVGDTGTSTFSGGVSALQFASTSGTSTGANGWEISDGCYAINGTCLGSGGSLGVWTDQGTFLDPTNSEGIQVTASSTFGDFTFVEATGTRMVIKEGAHFNSDSVPGSDFLIESDDNDLMFFVDYSADRIGIGTSSPVDRLHIWTRSNSSATMSFENPAVGLSALAGMTAITDDSDNNDAGDQMRFVVLNSGFINAYSQSTGRVTAQTGLKRLDLMATDDGAYVAIHADGSNFANQRAAFGIASTTFNEPGNNTDFRVEGDTDQFLLFADAGLDFVSIGSSTPGSLFSVEGVANFRTATSSFASSGGIDILNGCFAVNGVCVGGSIAADSITHTELAPNIGFWVGGTQLLDTTTDHFCAPYGVCSTTETQVDNWEAPSQIVANDLHCEINQAPAGGGAQWVCSVRINGSDSALTCTISAGALECDDTVNSVTISAGDTVNVHFDGTTPGQTTQGQAWAIRAHFND